MSKMWWVVAGLSVASCASNSGPIQIGPDTYLIEKESRTVLFGVGGLRTSAIQEAAAFCERRSATMEILSEAESSPPYIMGNFPRAEVRFMCHRNLIQ